MAQKSLIRGLAALSLACLMITAVLAQGTRLYPFTEVDRSRKSSDIEYDLALLSGVPAAEAARQLMCGSAWLTLDRGFAYFHADPNRGEGTATLDFYQDPPRRSSVISSDNPVDREEMERAVIDASWLAGVCEAELAAQTESLDPDELQAIRVRAKQIPLTAAAAAPAEEAPEMICVTEPPLGSNIPREFCATQAELDRIAKASRDWIWSDGEFGGLMEVNTID